MDTTDVLDVGARKSRARAERGDARFRALLLKGSHHLRRADVSDVPAVDRIDSSILAAVTEICRVCVTRADVDGAGVSVIGTTGALSTVCATDSTSLAIEEMQFTLGVGPCIDAHGLGVPVLLDDIQEMSSDVGVRWPGFAESLSATPARALFALPLRIGAIILGAIDLYRVSPGPLSTLQLAAALLSADTVAQVLLGLEVPESGAPAEDGTGISFRIEVHQAAGMVMEQLGVPIETALLVLRGTAYANSVSVNDIASDVVARRLRYPVEDA